MFDWLRKLFVGAEQKLDVNKDGKVDAADAKVVAEKVKEEVKEKVEEVKTKAKTAASKVKAGRPKKNG